LAALVFLLDALVLAVFTLAVVALVLLAFGLVTVAIGFLTLLAVVVAEALVEFFEGAFIGCSAGFVCVKESA